MRFLPKLLRKAVKRGRLTLHGPDGVEESFGDGDGPSATIRVTDPSFDWKIFLNPELRAAEAFMDEKLVVEDGGAIDLLRVFFHNKRSFDMSPNQIFFNGLARGARRFLQHNPIARSRANVGHHYDLGNDFYRLWLDPDMQYSCGYFPTGEETLEDAQILKKRHIAAKLGLEPGQKVLDIGCGWGGMALYLAAVAEVEVVGVTLSTEQLAIAKARAEAAGLSDRIDFRLQDYREVTETFDRVVSVGMLEHVGMPQMTGYFLNVRDRLGPDGVALIHSISTKSPPGITGPFIRKYIFPGGYSPSLSEMVACIEKTGLFMTDLEVWRVHYGHTLRAWRERFEAKRAEVEAMYDPRFARMWEFYLAACEEVFFNGSSIVGQAQMARRRDAMPLHRDYVADAAQRLAAKEPEALARIDAATKTAFGET